MTLTLDDIVDASPDTDVAAAPASPQGSLSATLDQIASSTVTQIFQNAAGAAAGRIEGALNNPRSTVTQPAPDLSAAAAKPQAAVFLNSKAFGVSTPLLILGAAALIYILVKRR